VKKFVWRLQRLLDIKIKQENFLRTELVAVTEQAVAVKGQIVLKKIALRQKLADLGSLEPNHRLSQQQFFLKFVHVLDTQIRHLKQALKEIEELRKRKIKEIMEIRRSRKSLEKLREKAKEEYTYEQNRIEQIENDDMTSIKYAREIMARM
jgi:flagellar FliJ protein